MNRYRLFASFFIVLAAVSCGKDDDSSGGGAARTRLVALSASFEPSSKAAVTSAGAVTWSAEDQLGVYTTEGNIRAFALSEGAGTATATFVADLPAGETPTAVAIYPKSGFKSCDGSSVTVNYPGSYTYASGAMNSPMAAIPSDGNLSFRHLGGLIQVVCNPVPDEATAFHLVCKDMRIVGNFSAGIAGDMTISSTASADNTKCKITFPAAVGDSKTFNVPVPAGEYESVYAYFTDASGNKIREWRVLEDVTVSAGDMYRRTMPALMRVMSYNWLLDSGTTDEKQPWTTVRKDNMIAALPTRYYDLMGSQESTTQQISDVQAAVPGYSVSGTTHGGYGLSSIGSTSAYSVTAIWRSSAVTLLDNGTFWFSSTPTVSSRRTGYFKDKNGADVTPSLLACNWAKLRYNGKVFYHFNTHMQVNGDGLTTGYDPVYTQIRLYQWSILKPRIAEVAGDYPVVLTGDFNNTASDEGDIIQTILADTDLNLVDAYSDTRQPHGSTGTLHYFRTTATTRRIDFVFVNNKFKVESYRVDASQQSTPLWESDHLPVLVDLSFVE